MQIGGINEDLHHSGATLRRNMNARSTKDLIYIEMDLTRGLDLFQCVYFKSF